MIHDKHTTLSYGEDESIFEYFSKSYKLISTHLQIYAFFHMTQRAKQQQCKLPVLCLKESNTNLSTVYIPKLKGQIRSEKIFPWKQPDLSGNLCSFCNSLVQNWYKADRCWRGPFSWSSKSVSL